MSSRLGILLAILAVVLIGSLTVVIVANPLASPSTGPMASPSPATITPPPLPPPPVGTTYRDFGFDPEAVSGPTSSKTQSRLWYAHGAWWAGMFARPANQLRIYRLDPVTQVWSDTATLIDERPTADADMVWTGTKLYAVSAGTRDSASHEIRISRFSFDEASVRFERDANFPVTIHPTGANATSIDIDSGGTLWVAYALGGRVWLARTLGDDAIWSTPIALEAPEARVDISDVAAIVAFGPGRIGVIWTNQLTASVYFSDHVEGAADDVWSTPETVIDALGSDDHVSVRTYPLADGSGRGVLAAVKTRLDQLEIGKSLDPLIMLAIRDGAGSWATHLVAHVRDRLARPTVMVDDDARTVYVAASSPANGGAIYYKRSSLDGIVFDTGQGTPLLVEPRDPSLNDAASTRQALTAESGLVVLAADSTTGRYAHGVVDLGGGLPGADPADPDRPEAAAPAPPGIDTSLLRDDFEPWPVGPAVGTGWLTREEDPSAALVIVDDGIGRALRVRTPAGRLAARACREFAEVPGAPLAIDARVRTSALGTSDTTLLSLRGTGGEAASVRVTDRGVLAWFIGETKIRSTRVVRPGTWYRVSITIDQAAGTYGLRFQSDGGEAPVVRADLAWRMSAVKSVRSICFETAGASRAQTIDVAEVQVLQVSHP